MKHSFALSQATQTSCQSELIHLYDGFWDDVNWGVNYCPTCKQIVCCVGNSVHHWNYTSVNPRPENLERGRQLAAEI